MSALGQKQTSERVRVMSALPPKADIGTQPRNVRFVPKADNSPIYTIASSARQEVFCNRTANAVFAFDGYRNGAKGYERGCAFGDRGRI